MAGLVSHRDAEDLRGDESWCGRGRPWCVCRARAPRGGGARDRARGGYPLSGYTWMRPGRPRRGERGGTRTGREKGDLSRSAVAASSPCFSACPQRCRVPLPVRWLGTPPPPAAASSTTVGLPQRPPSLLASKRQLPPPRAGSAWPGRTGPAHAVRGRGGGRATPARGTPRRGTIIMAAAAAATGAAATAKRPQPPSWLSPQPPLGRAVDVGWEWVGRGGGRARCQTGVRACHAGGGARAGGWGHTPPGTAGRPAGPPRARVGAVAKPAGPVGGPPPAPPAPRLGASTARALHRGWRPPPSAFS